MAQITLSMEPLPMPCTDFNSLPASTFLGYAARMPAVLLYARAANTLLPPAQLKNVPEAIVEQSSSRKSGTALQSCCHCWHAHMLDHSCFRIAVHAQAHGAVSCHGGHVSLPQAAACSQVVESCSVGSHCTDMCHALDEAQPLASFISASAFRAVHNASL